MNQSNLMTFTEKAYFNRWVEQKEIPGKDSITCKYLAYDKEGIPSHQGKTKII